MARVLVTGAAGFIGKHVVSSLVECVHEVHACHVADLSPGDRPDVVRHRADLLDQASRERLVSDVHADIMLHLAWYSAHGLFWSSPENLRWASASIDLARAFYAHGGRRFVGVGTCVEYAWGLEEPMDEASTRLEPTTLYGASNDAVRRVLDAYARTSGLSWAWARVFFLYGPVRSKRRRKTIRRIHRARYCAEKMLYARMDSKSETSCTYRMWDERWAPSQTRTSADR
jgi:nucleoside-diphosphate-sugar epimerase